MYDVGVHMLPGDFGTTKPKSLIEIGRQANKDHFTD
jgi:hypothetical protein